MQSLATNIELLPANNEVSKLKKVRRLINEYVIFTLSLKNSAYN